MAQLSSISHEYDGSETHLLFQKVGIFIDAENIELSGLKHHEARTDYKKLLDKVGDREIVRILYYKPEYKEISKDFETFWYGLGGEIRRPSKNADTFLVIDAVTLAEKIDVAIILGGDKDFLPLIWYLRSRGCRVEIWSWPEATSPEVKEAADIYFPITKEFVVPKRSSKAKKTSTTRRMTKKKSR
ncbi:MAG: NYN domain-containing protein [Bdellovibrionales bacterium]|nr:NYN domain-containing protein [Bdellovibrionales bacterium]